MFTYIIITNNNIYNTRFTRDKNLKGGKKIMKELNYVYVGKAKDYNLFKLLSQTMERKIKNENKQARISKNG